MDLRWISCLMCGWLALVLLIMTEIGIFSNPSFVAFGPRPTLTFMHVSIDTGYKYGMLVIMIVLHTLVSDFISDSLNPHVINTLQVARPFLPDDDDDDGEEEEEANYFALLLLLLLLLLHYFA
jgi:hypothetical protein